MPDLFLRYSPHAANSRVRIARGSLARLGAFVRATTAAERVVLVTDARVDGLWGAAARRALPPGRVLGASCYADVDRARAAVAAGADYVAFGAVCPSPTKPGAVRAPLDIFSRWHAESTVPACAIGGITLDTAPAIIAAGADLLAVITDLFAAPDIVGRAATYQRLFEE